MPSTVVQDVVLDSIEKLKKRKVRPELEHIFRMVQRKQDVPLEDVSNALEHLVKENQVKRVPHKSGMTYRLRPKLTNGWGTYESSTDKDSESSGEWEVGSEEEGTTHVSEETVDEGNSYQHVFTTETEGPLRSVSANTVSPSPEKHKNKKKGSTSYEEDQEWVPTKRTKLFLPALSNTGHDVARCDFCAKTAESNLKGDPEELLLCKDCRAKAHPSCMKYTDTLARRAMQSPWQCNQCKTCYICGDADDPDEMLFCDACDKGYHTSCHTPVITIQPSSHEEWICSRCQEERGQLEKVIPSQAQVSAPVLSPITSVSPNGVQKSEVSSTPTKCPVTHLPPLLRELPTFKDWVHRDIPDAAHWTVQEVVDFISKAGFPEEAKVFQKEEIDGASLLLLKRADVLQGLPILLGPALKIYTLIQILQTKGHFTV